MEVLRETIPKRKRRRRGSRAVGVAWLLWLRPGALCQRYTGVGGKRVYVCKVFLICLPFVVLSVDIDIDVDAFFLPVRSTYTI